jgi:hypothetical protein
MARSKDETDIKLIQQDILYIKESVNNINKKLEQDYVTRQEWTPYRTFLQGAISLILLAVGGAVMALIIKK